MDRAIDNSEVMIRKLYIVPGLKVARGGAHSQIYKPVICGVVKSLKFSTMEQGQEGTFMEVEKDIAMVLNIYMLSEYY